MPTVFFVRKNFMEIKIIGYIKTDFNTKFGLPKQSGMVQDIKGKIIFNKEYRVNDAFNGLSEFSHIWILWDFSKAHKDKWAPTVRPPALGGNKKMGVFATRSPFRPNSIGLSCVALEKIEYTEEYGPVLYVSGVDIMNNTPIYDIKPYLPYADSHPNAFAGFTENLTKRKLKVLIDENLLLKVPYEKRAELIGSLECDPRPSYINDSSRVYGFSFFKFEVKFKVESDVLTVTSIENQ